MTNEDRIREEINNHQVIFYNLLIDDALDRGEDDLSNAYKWMRDNKRWPCFHETNGMEWMVSYNLALNHYVDRGTTEWEFGSSHCFPTLFDALKGLALSIVERWKNMRKIEGILQAAKAKKTGSKYDQRRTSYP